MTTEVFLSNDQEYMFSVVRQQMEFKGSDQELVQRLFDEALKANFIPFKGTVASTEAPASRLACITFEADELPTDEEISEIMAEIHRADESREGEPNEHDGNRKS